MAHSKSNGVASSLASLTLSPTEAASVPAESPTAMSTPRKLKILMLHGYTQTGPLFHAKTRSLEKLLHKSFPPIPTSTPTASKSPSKSFKSPISTLYPGGISLTYPTAPIKLYPADIPGFQPPAEGEEKDDVFGWWKRETGSGTYVGLEEGLSTIAESIREIGGIDAVIGFSQGAAAAAMVASLLEPGRKVAYETHIAKNPDAFPYPKAFDGIPELCNNGEGLKFAISYSGFYAPNTMYGGFYEPKLKTEFLHFIGSLDSVVEESRSLAMVEICENAKAVFHPGGHFVPVGKEMASVVVGFIKEKCEVKEKKVEEDAADMDVPF